ncbi:sel1 repeat family protein [Campylobacter sp. 2018MI01]|uniref:tetratricopeptide repeat protein n=1 Tax=Campylobacter sp. 2018MI01 TaxID=2836735 RepID=UPI001BDB2213|nr:tetratricopeptide repeat protein [Campylobacter sp. 2018MI01]MBT0877821.1 sel1 repeat family protein [Campylobacter sp. 2018MI01]
MKKFLVLVFCVSACFANNQVICNNANDCYNIGIAKAKEMQIAESIKYLEKSCELNYMSACMELGTAYIYSAKSKEEFTKGINYYMLACNNNEPISCHNIAYMLEQSQNPALMNEIKSYYEKSCNLRYLNACTNLGNIYYTKENNKERAKMLYEKACNLGEAIACNNLGNFYYYTNKSLAKEYVRKACNLGYQVACEYKID